MKELVDVAIFQFVPARLNAHANLERMAAAVRETTRKRPIDLAVFPELATTGYVPAEFDPDFHARLAEESDSVPGRITSVLGAVAEEEDVYIAAGFSERGSDGQLFNSILLAAPDGEWFVHRKVHLFQSEPSYFMPGDSFSVIDTELGNVGLSICYDSKFPEAARCQVLAGAEILVCIFAYAPDPGVPPDILTHRAIVRSWENAAFFVLANRLGTEDAVEFIGRSVVTGPLGEVLAVGDGEQSVVYAQLRRDALEASDRRALLEAERRPDAYLTPGTITRSASSRALQ